MPVDTLLTAAIELMVIGMGTVFIILCLLIGCMNMLSLFAPSEKSVACCNDENTIVAVIQSAIHQYRNRPAQKPAAL